MCTWTKLDAMVQLRPQFGHIDAFHASDKSVYRQERALEERAITKFDLNEAQAVNMAVKSAESNDDSDMYGGMSETAKLLKAMRDEPWQRLAWIDQDVSATVLPKLSVLLIPDRRMSHITSTMRISSIKIQRMHVNLFPK